MSNRARRLPVSVAVERVLWPVTTAAAVAEAPRRLVPPPPGTRPAPLPVYEPLLPSNLADRITVAEEQAYARGVAEGERAAGGAATSLMEPVLARLAAAIADLAAARVEVLRRSERDLVRLALAIGEHVIRASVERDRHHLVTMAHAAIERLGGMTAVTVRLNPADLDVVRVAHPEALSGASVEVISDPQVPRGGCVVRSSSGVIDAGVDAQVRELRRGLLGQAPAAAGESQEPAAAGDSHDPAAR
jgi:flagellar assembly protein FliH